MQLPALITINLIACLTFAICIIRGYIFLYICIGEKKVFHLAVFLVPVSDFYCDAERCRVVSLPN